MNTGTTTTGRWTADCSVVLLDLDGTLVDSADAVLRGWHTWAQAVGAPVEGIADLVHGRSAAETITTLLPDVSADQLHGHVRHVLGIQEVDPAPALPMTGAAMLVEALGPHRWAVVTGCSVGMAAARLAAGGLPRPDVLVTDEDVEAGKPHPDGYLLALRRLGLSPADAIAVEDAPAGVAAAKVAGIRTVAVTGTHPAEALAEADVVTAGLEQIRVTAAGRRLSLTVEALSLTVEALSLTVEAQRMRR
jgi:sugar-phosphatase